MTKGIHKGGIVSWLDEAGQPSSIYGEITGYYLTCSHFIVSYSGINEAIEHRLELAENWLNSIWQTSVPLTRYYLTEKVDDWRNHVTFSFDLGMMLRGLSWENREENQSTRETIIEELSRFIEPDGTLSPYRQFAGDSLSLPVKWSTQPHPFR